MSGREWSDFARHFLSDDFGFVRRQCDMCVCVCVCVFRGFTMTSGFQRLVCFWAGVSPLFQIVKISFSVCISEVGGCFLFLSCLYMLLFVSVLA